VEGGWSLSTASAVGEAEYRWVPQEARHEWVRRNQAAFEQLRTALTFLPEPPVEWPCESLHARFIDAVFGLTNVNLRRT
jgi:hypothetical protein